MSESDSNDSWQSSASLADELFECCTSGCLSEECICAIIERHKLTPHHNNQVSDYRFFRMACCNDKITKEIIQYLLEYFPDAASTADDEGQLPLHYILLYACDSDNVSLDVIQLLIDVAPDSVRCEDNDGDMPLHILCAITQMDEINHWKF